MWLAPISPDQQHGSEEERGLQKGGKRAAAFGGSGRKERGLGVERAPPAGGRPTSGSGGVQVVFLPLRRKGRAPLVPQTAGQFHPLRGRVGDLLPFP